MILAITTTTVLAWICSFVGAITAGVFILSTVVGTSYFSVKKTKKKLKEASARIEALEKWRIETDAYLSQTEPRHSEQWLKNASEPMRPHPAAPPPQP